MLEIEANFFSQWLQQQKKLQFVSLVGDQTWQFFSVQLVLRPIVLYWDKLHGFCESAGGYNNDIVAMSGKKEKENVGFVKSNFRPVASSFCFLHMCRHEEAFSTVQVF